MLSYKTKNNASLQGKSKIYFCCHPQDFKLYFESISDELLGITSCAIWYSDVDGVQKRDELFYNELSQMKLVVVPVTSRLLNTDNPAINEEIPFAFEHNIPVLPLMQEKGIETDFAKRFKDIQFLDKCTQDDTAISYSEKLKKYITGLIIGDEQVQKIRNEFYAKLFLSYRKKDRWYANELMKIIHSIDSCRDIAIWYDEFLTLGEDFNKSIETALKQSDAFLIAVTPNLVNEENYVQSTEYPCAKQENKPIVPVEMVETDKSLLAEKYPDIPGCLSSKEAQGLKKTLHDALEPKSYVKNTSAEHEYLIGLAYLNGIDVEVNRERALELITRSAESGCGEAMQQLVGMYRYGDGVKRDVNVAIKWQEKYVEFLDKIYQTDRTLENAKHYALADFELGGIFQQIGKYDDAKNRLRQLGITIAFMRFALVGEENSIAELDRIQCLVYAVMGEIAHAEGAIEEEEQFLNDAIEISERLNDEWDGEHIKRDLSVFYLNKSKFFKVRDKIDDAIIYAEKALSVQKLFAETSDEPQFRFDIAYTYNQLSEFYRMKGIFSVAKECSLCAVERLERLIRDEKTCVYLEYNGIFHLGLAECYRLSGEIEAAVTTLDETEKILKNLEEVFDYYQWHTKYYCLVRRAQICIHEGKHDKIIEYALKALKIQEEHHVIDEESEITGDTSLSLLPYFLSTAYYAKGDMKLAYEYAEQSAKYMDEMCSGKASRIADTESIAPYSHYASMLILREKFSQAEKYLNKALEKMRENGVADTDFRGSALLSSLWFAFGRIHLMQDNFEKAFEYFEKSEHSYDRYFEFVSTDQEYMEYSTLYLNMGYCLIEINPSLSVSYFTKIVSLIEKTSIEDRPFIAWTTLGVAYYYLYLLSGIFKRGKCKKKLLELCDTMCELYPDIFLQSELYQLISELN